ncbi:hypothetical protein SUGI_0767810 [Cryptomeria japonica]|uniref:RING-H2 finger protein ATL32-like n=1 Tax=Cryptomeria japonica TaxID=3369 RepID=UPI002414CCB7|nr:RING-H2 finger protein ATL32-like [Cryptomeria japonica]GLJ37775.1 hypothetical protein SUGI_0767810 [Cryptomeria japonica]
MSICNSSEVIHRHFFGSNGFGYELCIAMGLVMLMLVLLVAFLRCTKEPPNAHATTIRDNGEESSSREDGLEAVRDSHSTIVYDSKHAALAQLEDRSCSICLDDYRDWEILRILMDCKHVYHVDCIDAWLMRSASCPICRNCLQCL